MIIINKKVYIRVKYFRLTLLLEIENCRNVMHLPSSYNLN